MNRLIYEAYEKYSKYDYIDVDVTSTCYHIKSKQEFYSLRGGVCWDFVGPICDFLRKCGIISYCFFTGIYRDGEMIASHTYVIVSYEMKSFWIECAWQPFKGIHKVKSFSDVESLLKESYSADEVHTTIYDPSRAYGLSTDEFFKYLDKHGVELT